mmetsp:Transcript_11727/g.17201  ORF Transcript_11727/g.17201 Transcript_11727/m.17201 type:complete len:314 (+) Transcript_11727:72-1013(+)|eukprot:CAMPEP_0194211758 /NCGR_PEP_ID=MMETSP0156-20130528/11120_1 /TAXON_ID=33649 /ORGANISM="Thalassionema nitzschioides, Strain L26-B" /LENGTH=313 /DNA_ID=CAMNT_0038939411 /DNA_START=46 /DNA_END=987 /DNA_ORIENTATION=+
MTNLNAGNGQLHVQSGCKQRIPTNSNGIFEEPLLVTEPGKRTKMVLHGEYYNTVLYTPVLGVMFFKPQELKNSIFFHVEEEKLNELEEFPVVAFIAQGSQLRGAGVHVGHILVQVNGIEVITPREACKIIKEGPRPLNLTFCVPADIDATMTEGEHMVKYDTPGIKAPNGSRDWKFKYVVIGGIIAHPWMMNMYKSKAEYDLAVIETQSGRPVSVKVKQFSLKNARILNGFQRPQTVKYSNQESPWEFIVIMDAAQYPIKIAAGSTETLMPVLEGIHNVMPKRHYIDKSGPEKLIEPNEDEEDCEQSMASSFH